VGLNRFERRLERMVEGSFSRVFKSGLKPVELGRRLVRDMDANRSIGVHGEPVAPNHFVIELAPVDAERFHDVVESLRRELAESAREHARDEGYHFLGPVGIEFSVGERLREGNFRLRSSLREGERGKIPGSLVLPDGERIVLGEAVVTIGRLDDSTLLVEDPNVSRAHAEIRPRGTGFVLVDLGSTNGTRVNGERIAERELRDGDMVSFGSVIIRFEAS
jgi:hypothetical protein